MSEFINNKMLDESGTYGGFLALEWEAHMMATGKLGTLIYTTFPEGDSIGRYSTARSSANLSNWDVFVGPSNLFYPTTRTPNMTLAETARCLSEYQESV